MRYRKREAVVERCRILSLECTLCCADFCLIKRDDLEAALQPSLSVVFCEFVSIKQVGHDQCVSGVEHHPSRIRLARDQSERRCPTPGFASVLRRTMLHQRTELAHVCAEQFSRLGFADCLFGQGAKAQSLKAPWEFHFHGCRLLIWRIAPSFLFEFIKERLAQASANLFSLVMTARANDVESYAYLNYLFEYLPARRYRRADRSAAAMECDAGAVGRASAKTGSAPPATAGSATV